MSAYRRTEGAEAVVEQISTSLNAENGTSVLYFRRKSTVFCDILVSLLVKLMQVWVIVILSINTIIEPSSQ